MKDDRVFVVRIIDVLDQWVYKKIYVYPTLLMTWFNWLGMIAAAILAAKTAREILPDLDENCCLPQHYNTPETCPMLGACKSTVTIIDRSFSTNNLSVVKMAAASLITGLTGLITVTLWYYSYPEKRMLSPGFFGRCFLSLEWGQVTMGLSFLFIAFLFNAAYSAHDLADATINDCDALDSGNRKTVFKAGKAMFAFGILNWLGVIFTFPSMFGRYREKRRKFEERGHTYVSFNNTPSTTKTVDSFSVEDSDTEERTTA